jgi:gas vesicle protein
MLGNARTAMKFLFYGLVIGLLFAPRSGKETRKELIGWVSATVQDTVKNATGGGSKQGEDETQPLTT